VELSSSHPPHPAIPPEQDELEPVVGDGRGAATGGRMWGNGLEADLLINLFPVRVASFFPYLIV
jgi:hypothetical protein